MNGGVVVRRMVIITMKEPPNSELNSDKVFSEGNSSIIFVYLFFSFTSSQYDVIHPFVD